MHRRYVYAHAPHAERMQARELRVRDILIDVYDSPACGADFAHRVEHARVVPRISARLHEHEALEPQRLRQAEIFVQRCEGWLVTQLRIAGRIAIGGTEDMEVRVARERGRAKRGLALFHIP